MTPTETVEANAAVSWHVLPDTLLVCHNLWRSDGTARRGQGLCNARRRKRGSADRAPRAIGSPTPHRLKYLLFALNHLVQGTY